MLSLFKVVFQNYINRFLKNSKIKIFFILLLPIVALEGYGHTRQKQTTIIIKKMNLIEAQQRMYSIQLEPFKYQATKADNIRIAKIENLLSQKEISKKMHLAFQELFNDKEINDIYNFIETSAFEKLMNSERTLKAISFQFQDIDKMIEDMKASFNEMNTEPDETLEPATKNLEPIFVERENGFYETVGSSSTKVKDIKLKSFPSLTFKDILKVEKTYNEEFFRWDIHISFTKEGARKFTLLTKKNIGKPIAIVVDKQIISAPLVVHPIIGGSIRITGNFTKEETDKIMKKLKNK